mgnify:FL=1
MHSSEQHTPSLFWRNLIGGLIAIFALVLASFQLDAPQKWLINSILLPEDTPYQIDFEHSTGFFPFNTHINQLNITIEDSVAGLQGLIVSDVSYAWKVTALAKGQLEFPFLHAQGVSALIGGSMATDQAHNEPVDSVLSEFNRGLELLITELTVGIDSIKVKSSSKGLDFLGHSDKDRAILSSQKELVIRGGGATLGFQKRGGDFRIDIPEFRSELKLPNWIDEINFSGRFTGSPSSWLAENLIVTTSEFSTEAELKQSGSKYELALQSAKIDSTFYNGLASLILPSTALETMDTYGFVVTELVGTLSLDNEDIGIENLQAISRQGRLVLEGNKSGDRWFIEGDVLEWDPGMLASIAKHHSFLATETLASRKMHFLFEDTGEKQRIDLRSISNQPINPDPVSEIDLTFDIRRQKKSDSTYSSFTPSLKASATFNQFVVSDWLVDVLPEEQVTISGTVDLNQVNSAESRAEYDLSLQLPKVNIGELEFNDVVLNIAPDTTQTGPLEVGTGADLQQFQHYTISAGFDSGFGKLSWEGMGRYGLSVMEIESSFQMDSLFLYSKPQDAIASSANSANTASTASTANSQMNLNEALKKTGKAELSRYLSDYTSSIPKISGNFNASFEDNKLSEGVFSADIPSIITQDTTWLDRQFFIDYIAESSQRQQLRVTSSPLDFQVEGVINPSSMSFLYYHWSHYVNREWNRLRFNDLPQTPSIAFKKSGGTKSRLADSVSYQTQLEWEFALKDNELVQAIWAKNPIQKSSMVVNGRLDANRDRILMNVDIFDSDFQWKTIQIDSLNSQLTASFRYDSTSLNFSVVESRTNVKAIQTSDLELGDVQWQVSMQADSIRFNQRIGSLPSGAFLESSGDIFAAERQHNIVFDALELGSGSYIWSNLGDIAINVDRELSVVFNQVSMHNNDELLDIRGVYSDSPEDSIQFIVDQIQLDRLAELLNVKQDIDGVMDGQFSTRTLQKSPSVQGYLTINSFSLNNQVVGDLSLSSTFNSLKNRFDTQISVFTDSTLYPDYFNSSGRAGQNVAFNGYINTPGINQTLTTDTLYYFDLNFDNIDLWILPFLSPNVFSEMSGTASGMGNVWGSNTGYDFSINYSIGEIDPVFIRPRFLDTYYYAAGPLEFSSENGLVFQDFFIMDPSGGTANLNGSYNLNRFGPIHDIDLNLQMNEFHFLNTGFDEEAPFFGQGYGTALIRMTGTNENPLLFSEGPIQIGPYSSIGLPLIERTEFEENNKFIRFVDNFTNVDFANLNNKSGINGSQNEIMGVQEARSFTERFTLDLQFESQIPMTVELIFDPITGDQITANGLGNIRIQLQDEAFSVFGQFDIQDGEYNFVSGDIFTRTFELIPGGTLRWDGDPIDAKLNVQALYEARPDINTLTRTRDQIDQEQASRVPVELVLSIGGSLESIENDFFFRLPNTFETQQNSTLKTQINALNRNEDEKLIQATSFLLMGDFIPSSSAVSDATNSLTNNFSGSAAVLNPLLSSQLISPLLSNQMNSLLRSDIGSLDIDFNLNTYNNIDLGVALRLYNDRIILSREGQITGSQSTIGDIGATYKINQALALTAFHRQDPTFSNYSGSDNSQQSQDINGIGLETEVSFSSWRSFLGQLFEPVTRLFTRKEEEPALSME